MNKPMPTFADFTIAEPETKKITHYFAAFPDRGRQGLCIVASPDAKLRTDLLYALLGKYAEVGGVEHSIDRRDHYDRKAYFVPNSSGRYQVAA